MKIIRYSTKDTIKAGLIYNENLIISFDDLNRYNSEKFKPKAKKGKKKTKAEKKKQETAEEKKQTVVVKAKKEKKKKTDREIERAAKYKIIKKIRGKPNFNELEKNLKFREGSDIQENKIHLCTDTTCGNKVMCFEYEGKIWKESRGRHYS